MVRMEDGKPKLGLNVTMNEIFSEEDDFSIVSHPSSPEEMENGPYSHLEHLKITAPSVMSESQQHMLEVETQLKDILQENNDLRDALTKNNATLQEQFTTLSQWRDQTLRSQARHRQMIEDSCQINQQLQQDKDSLLKENVLLLEQIEQQKQERELQENKLKDEITKMEKDLAERGKHIEQLCEELDRSQVDVMTNQSNNKVLQAEIAQLKEENEKLSNQNSVIVEQLERQSTAQEVNRVSSPESTLASEEELGYSVIANPNRICSSRDALEEEARSLREKFYLEEKQSSDLQETIREQRAQLDEYENQFAMSRKQTSNQEALILNKLFHNNSYFTAPSKVQNYQDRCESVGQQLGACQERLESLRLEDDSKTLAAALKIQVEELQILLKQEKEEKAVDKLSLEESKKQVEQMSNEYRRLLSNWETYESDQISKGRQNEALNAISRRQHQEQLDELTAKVVTMEEEAQVKKAEVERLKGQIALLQRDSEQLPILRAQVEVYHQDFDSEKEARLKAQAELENRKQEINNLHAQLIHLTDEINQQSQQQILQMAATPQQQPQTPEEPSATAPYIETFTMPRSPAIRITRRHYTGRDRRSNPLAGDENNTPHLRRSLESEVERYECPSCKLGYTTIQGVQNHMDNCLGPNSPYP